jgi:hypothetical protein
MSKTKNAQVVMLVSYISARLGTVYLVQDDGDGGVDTCWRMEGYLGDDERGPDSVVLAGNGTLVVQNDPPRKLSHEQIIAYARTLNQIDLLDEREKRP